MGKAKKPKHRSVSAANPIGLPPLSAIITAAAEDDEFDSPRPDPVGCILEQLQSAVVEEKMCGLQTLSTLCQNEQQINDILQSDIVRIAAPMIVDANESVRHSAVGAIRNLSAVNVEVCETLVELDVFTPLLVLLNQYAMVPDWTPTFDEDRQLDQRSDIFLQAVNIVWNLCESTSVALETFNQSQLLQSLVRCMNWGVFGTEIAVAVAQCLLVISEDNAAAWKVLSGYVEEFLALIELDGDYGMVMLRTLAAGIMANVPALGASYLNQILAALGKTLDVNHRTVLGQITSSLPLMKRKDVHELEIADENQTDAMETEEAAHRRRRRADLPSDLEKEVKLVEWLLLAQRIAAETLTNICSTDDDDWAEEGDDGSSETESVHDYDAAAATSSHNSSMQAADRLSLEVLEPLKALGVVERLWQRAQPLPENVFQILRESGKGLMRRYLSLRASLLLCLQNLCIAISTEDLGGADAIYTVWLELGQQVFQENQPVNIVEASTALMRAALEHLRSHPELFKGMNMEDLQLMLKGVQSCNNTEIRANWLRMLGILGCLLPEPLVRVIVEFTIDACLKETDAWTLSEGIDSFMDMFSDNDWNQLVFELALAQRVKEIEKLFKAKLRTQKRELADRFPACSTVRTNLSRFAKYLEKTTREYKPQAAS